MSLIHLICGEETARGAETFKRKPCKWGHEGTRYKRGSSAPCVECSRDVNRRLVAMGRSPLGEMSARERPLVLREPMVHACLDGRKTRHSALVRPQPPRGEALEAAAYPPCPFGEPGHLLWVQEAWRVHQSFDGVSLAGLLPDGVVVQYEAGGTNRSGDLHDMLPGAGRRRRANGMPGWASRITLEIADVRTQRLGDMTDADAIAEGVEQLDGGLWRNYRSDDEDGGFTSPKGSFFSLWESVNGSDSWDPGLWVWVIELRRTA